MAVTHDKVEEAVLEQLVFDAAEDGGRVAFADLGHNDANGVSALLAQALAPRCWRIAVERRGMKHALLRFFGNAMRGRLSVDNARDRGLRELENGCELFQRDRLDRCFSPGRAPVCAD